MRKRKTTKRRKNGEKKWNKWQRKIEKYYFGVRYQTFLFALHAYGGIKSAAGFNWMLFSFFGIKLPEMSFYVRKSGDESSRIDGVKQTTLV